MSELLVIHFLTNIKARLETMSNSEWYC